MKIRLLLLIGSCAMQAMDLVPFLEFQKNKQPLQIKTIQDIPKISFENIESCFLDLSANKRFDLWKEKNKKGTCLADSLTFNVALLPHDVRLKIVRLMFNGDQQSAEKFYRTPLLYACKRYQDTISAVLYSSKKEKSEKWIAMFFRLSAAQQNEITGFTDQSAIRKFIYGGSTINQDKYEEIQLYDDEMQKELLNGEDVVLLTGEELTFTTHRMVKACGGFTYGGMVIGCVIGGLFMAVPITIMTHSLFGLIPIFVMPVIGGAIGGIIGCMQEGRDIRNAAQKIDI
jgi:hypothetical protein